MSNTQKELLLLQKELELLKAEEIDRDLNPHKYFDLYDWQDEFIYQAAHQEEYGRYPHRMYLTCANQVGKSFALMCLGHYICTNKEFRKKQWGNNIPRVIWYVLPTQEHINDFFNEKWEPDVLSRDSAKESGEFSWKVVKKGSDIKGIYFKETKCTLQFITLSARSSSMQGRSIGAVLFDEEPPEDKLAEIETRTASFNDPITGLSNAILGFAFTPTTAQDYFKAIFSFQDEKFLSFIPLDLKNKFFLDLKSDTHRTCTIEEEKNERFKKGPTVWKRRVSMFEAKKFKSGNRGRYTEGRIREFIKDQPTKRDVMVRAFAQFEKEDNGGLLYKYFKKEQHLREVPHVDINYYKTTGVISAAIDYGSGSNHPGGIVMTWVSDDRKKVRVIKMWRGDKGKVTTAGDIVQKYLEMSAGFEVKFPFYDPSMADLATIYNRITGKSLITADKKVDKGVGLVDALLQNNMILFLYHEGEPYGDWIASEYNTINHNQPKKYRLDELTDCVRYSLSGLYYMFDLKNLEPTDSKEELKKEIHKLKTPEDYGVRSWENVKDDKYNEEEEWANTEQTEWEGFFNEQ